MPNESPRDENPLDKFFNSQKEQKEKKDEAQRKVWRVQNTFIADFRKSLNEIIHPAMLAICSKLRDKHCYALWLRGRREKSNPLEHIAEFAQPPKMDVKANMLYKHYENYYVAAPELAAGKAFIITMLGNYSLQKVCVITEYVKHNHSKPSTSVKKTEEQFELSQIAPELFDTIVADRMKEMLALLDKNAESNPTGRDIKQSPQP